MNCYEVNIRLMQTLVSEDFVPGILLFWQISIFFSKREREREVFVRAKAFNIIDMDYLLASSVL